MISATVQEYAAVALAEQMQRAFGMVPQLAKARGLMALGKLLALAVSLGDRFVPARRIPFREGERYGEIHWSVPGGEPPWG